MNDKTRILIADDHAVVRQGLVLVLNQEQDFEVVGEAKNGAEAVSLVADTTPHLALLDWKMPKMDGLQAAQAIKKKTPSVHTLLLSGAPVETAVLDALDQGVDGFVHKDISSDGLCHAIRVVAGGQRYLGSEITQALLARSRQTAVSPQPISLSPRELEVLQLMATPVTYKEMALQLNISETTIHTHVKRIFAKMNQSTRTQAVIMGLRTGLIAFD
ncbi:MAG: response regulator transcription factor [Chloroflexi bacterium]|nr:response regulator transcription factor [Chloroflexota bacterium]